MLALFLQTKPRPTPRELDEPWAAAPCGAAVSKVSVVLSDRMAGPIIEQAGVCCANHPIAAIVFIHGVAPAIYRTAAGVGIGVFKNRSCVLGGISAAVEAQ